MTIRLKRSQVERLFSYYHYLVQHHDSRTACVSSARLAEFQEIDATQVRKDLAAAGIRGRPRRGYAVGEVLDTIGSILGLGSRTNAIIVGAGRLGGAIAEYAGFASYGISFVALFDADPEKIGTAVGGKPVHDVARLPQLAPKLGAKLGVITVPVEAAQGVADALVAAGIRAIWNFAHTNLSVPRDVWIRHEHISRGLAELTYHLKRSTRRI